MSDPLESDSGGIVPSLFQDQGTTTDTNRIQGTTTIQAMFGPLAPRDITFTWELLRVPR